MGVWCDVQVGIWLLEKKTNLLGIFKKLIKKFPFLVALEIKKPLRSRFSSFLKINCVAYEMKASLWKFDLWPSTIIYIVTCI